MATTSTSSASSLAVGGLISGIDTTSIVNALVAQQQVPITRLQTQQSAFKTQVSQIGDIISKLQAFKTAAQALASTGALANAVTSSNSSFSAAAGAGSQAGSYSVRVDQLARPSKWMSAGFAAATDTVASGSLTLSVGGTTYDPITTDNMTLADVAYAIRQSGAPVSATVLSGWDSANNRAVSYLSVTALKPGYTPGSAPPDSLSLSFAASGAGAGTDPGFAEKQTARNALFNVDGVDYVRAGNTVTDAIPNVTLTLKQGATSPATQGTAEDLSLANDQAQTTANLQSFADAYNSVMSLVQKALAVTKDTDRTRTLAGDSAVRSLQGLLHGVISHGVSGLAGVRTLADVGLKSNRDGSLTVDATTLADALGRDPAAIDSIFKTTTTGISDVVAGLVDRQTSSGSGILALDQKGLSARIDAMDTQITQMQMRVDAYKTGLAAQFAAMENTLSSLKATGNYLTSQSTSSSSSG
jgi:flagellar hook-associated protein 2